MRTNSVTVKNNATNAAAAAVGSVILTATNGTFNAGATSAGFSLAPGAQTTLTGFVTLARATTTAAAVSVAANPSATGYSPVGKTATVAPALGNVAVTINGSGSTFSVSATNAAGNPPATVVVPLSEVHGGSAVSITWTPNASGLNWSWDNATRTATLTVPAGPAVATGTLLTANGLGGNNKYATVSPGGAVSFVGQVFPSTGPTAVTLGRP